MWGEKQRELDARQARIEELIEERDEARKERDDARANRRRIQDLYDDLVAERDAKRRTAKEKPGLKLDARQVSRVATAVDRPRAAESSAELTEVKRQLRRAQEHAGALDLRVLELQAANISYSREAYDQAAAVRRAEVSGVGA